METFFIYTVRSQCAQIKKKLFLRNSDKVLQNIEYGMQHLPKNWSRFLKLLTAFPPWLSIPTAFCIHPPFFEVAFFCGVDAFYRCLQHAINFTSDSPLKKSFLLISHEEIMMILQTPVISDMCINSMQVSQSFLV